jgi:branched-chain amino acid transport system permease protein
MEFNLQLLFTGIGVGSIYALVALGFALIYRATNVVNFAQGDFAMLGAFAMVVMAIDLELPYWLSIVITLVLLLGFGALFNLGVYYPLRNRSFLPVIISTIGASILLENGVLAAYGPRPQSLDSIFAVPGFSIGDVFFDSQYIVILVVTVVMVVLQYLFFERTLLGKKMQATSQDKEMASLLGIPVMLMIMITFMYSAMLGGLAGILVAPILFVTVSMGSSIALKAFAASIIGGFGDVTVIGGFGDVTGAIVGGLALGVIETFGAAYISVPYKDAFAFLVLFVFLLVRPQGIFGERISEKA